MTATPFWKMHGTGNDFVLLESELADDPGWPALAERICDRHFGVGADGLIFVLPSQVADRRMRIFNPDGSEAEMCGNGIRCFVKYLLDRDLVSGGGADAAKKQNNKQQFDAGAVRVETEVGILDAHAT